MIVLAYFFFGIVIGFALAIVGAAVIPQLKELISMISISMGTKPFDD